MKKVFIVALVLAMAMLLLGCAPSGNSLYTASAEGEAGDDSAGSDQAGADTPLNPDGLSEADFNRIDWNTDAYSTYYKVISGDAVIHYWNGGKTVLMQVPDMLLYVSGENSIAVDLISGTVSNGFGAAFVPPSITPTSQQGPTYRDFTGVDVFLDDDMYVYSFEVDGGTAEYYINSSLVCVGWTYTSEEGSVAYILNDSISFEDAVDDVFREYATGSSGSGDDRYADTDGDGYSDWNEDRLPSPDEFDYITDLWKSGGLTGAEYFDKVDKLMGMTE